MSKTPLSYQAQLDLLKSRGLIVNDESFALHCLAHYNYYRLSAYRFPFTVPLAEQKRIVAKVDELMALCDALEAQLTTSQSESQQLLEACLNEAIA